MKSFKFLTNNKINPTVFNLNVMGTNLFGRIQSYVLYIEPNEPANTDECTHSLRDIIYGPIQLPTMVYNGVLLKRVDGEYVEINYNNVDEVNNGNLIFGINDRITLRYKV